MADPIDREPPGLDTLATARHWLGEGRPLALATVISTWGSSPVPVGGQMVIASDDRFEGSVSGGCIEGEVIVTASEVIADGRPRVMTFGVSNETAWQAGLPCGGTVSVLVARLQPGAHASMLDDLLAAGARRDAVALVTVIDSGALTLHASGEAQGEIGEAIRQGESRVVAHAGSASQFVHVLVPRARIVVVGATHIAQHLVAMLRLIGYETVVVDPRTAYATRERFGGDVRLVTEWPDDALPALGLEPFTAVVAVAHVPDIDDPALRLALRAGCFYVGALGSTRNHARRKERLAAAGLGADEIARIRAPIGLDIGAEGPAEIAVSIIAEIIAHLRMGKPA